MVTREQLQLPKRWQPLGRAVHERLDPCYRRYPDLRLPTAPYEQPLPLSALTYVGTGNNSSASSGTTLDITYTATAGSLLVAWCKWEGGSTTLAVARSDASEGWTEESPATHGNGDLSGCFAYLLSCSGGASVTYRMTLGASRSYRSFILFEYSYTGTCSLDGTPAIATGTSTAPNSGNITTTGTDGVGFGGYSEYTADNGSSHEINNVSADGTVELAADTYTAAWRKTYTSGFTGAADCTLGGSNAWVCGIICFKATAGGGGTNPKGIFGLALDGPFRRAVH